MSPARSHDAAARRPRNVVWRGTARAKRRPVGGLMGDATSPWIDTSTCPRGNRLPSPLDFVVHRPAIRPPESLFSVRVAARFGQLFPELAAGLAPSRTGARPFLCEGIAGLERCRRGVHAFHAPQPRTGSTANCAHLTGNARAKKVRHATAGAWPLSTSFGATRTPFTYHHLPSPK